MHSLARIVSSCWHFSWFVAALPALMASRNLKTSNCNSQNFQTFWEKAGILQNSSEQDHSLVMRRWNLQMHIETLACGWYQCFGSVRHLDSSFCFAFTPRIINNMTTLWSSLSRPRHQIIRSSETIVEIFLYLMKMIPSERLCILVFTQSRNVLVLKMLASINADNKYGSITAVIKWGRCWWRWWRGQTWWKRSLIESCQCHLGKEHTQMTGESLTQMDKVGYGAEAK